MKTIISIFVFSLLLAAAATAQVKATIVPGQRSVTLSFSDSATDVTEFRFYRGSCPGGEDYSNPIGVAPGSATEWTDATVVSGSTYCYTMTAFRSVPGTKCCESAPSNPETPVGPIPFAPPSPSINSASVN